MDWSSLSLSFSQTYIFILSLRAFPRGSEAKYSPANSENLGLIGKIPWSRKQQPTPVFLPGKSQGQRCLASYSPWGRKESDIT